MCRMSFPFLKPRTFLPTSKFLYFVFHNALTMLPKLLWWYHKYTGSTLQTHWFKISREETWETLCHFLFLTFYLEIISNCKMLQNKNSTKIIQTPFTQDSSIVSILSYLLYHLFHFYNPHPKHTHIFFVSQ